MSANLERVANLVREFGELGGQVLRDELQMPADQAVEIGLRIAQRVCAEFAGTLIYVPTGFATQITERDQALYAEYCRNGHDVGALAHQFELSVQQVYKRIRLIEAQELARRQPGLFDE